MWQQIQTITASGSSSTLAATSISQSFDNLRIVVTGRSSGSAAYYSDIRLQLNGDTGANYNLQIFETINATVTAAASANQNYLTIGALPSSTAAANFAGQFVIDIINYKNTTFYKTVGNVSAWCTATVAQGQREDIGGAWANTAAINAITLTDATGNFVSGSTMWIYGY
jgi:hypothetical protein